MAICICTYEKTWRRVCPCREAWAGSNALRTLCASFFGEVKVMEKLDSKTERGEGQINAEDRSSLQFKSHWIDAKERTLNREFGDIVGLVSPVKVIDDPDTAMQALLQIRRIADFIERITYHTDCGGLELAGADFRVLGNLAGCIHEGAGYIVEYLERDVQPRFREEYAEHHREERGAILEGAG